VSCGASTTLQRVCVVQVTRSKRMMRLEPTTFCMANASDVRTRSRPCAQSALFAASSSERANATAPERTPNLAILATPRSASRGFDRRLRVNSLADADVAVIDGSACNTTRTKGCRPDTIPLRMGGFGGSIAIDQAAHTAYVPNNDDANVSFFRLGH